MHLRQYALSFVAMFVGISCVLLPSQAHAFKCSDGKESHLATQAEADAASPTGSIVMGQTQVCTVAQAGITEEVGKAKEQLNSMWCGGKAATCGPYKSDVEHLDPKFAVCAAQFIAKIREKDPSICIASAFRSTEHQAYLCRGGCGRVNGPCAAAGKSKHQSGRAIDIEKPRYNTLPAWVHQMAREGGGVSFPVPNDDGHMEPSSTSGDCATPGFIAPGNGAGLTTSPTSQFANLARQWLAPQPMLPPQPPLPMQPITPQQSPLGAFMQPVAITPTAGTDVVTGGVSDQLGGTDKSTGTSSADALEKLAFGDKATSTVSATSVPLIINGKDVGGLRSETNRDVSSASSSGSGSITQNTFVTNDLAWQASSVGASQNSFVKILASIRQTLLQMLQFLKPFGATQTQSVSE